MDHYRTNLFFYYRELGIGYLLAPPSKLSNNMTSETIDMDQSNHDDIWDDSMLIDSWNEALKEYKVFSNPSTRCNMLLLRIMSDDNC